MGRPTPSVPIVQAVCAIVLMSTVVYAVVGVTLVSVKAVTPLIPSETAPLVTVVFIAGGLLAIAASMLMRLMLTARLPREGGTLEERARILLVSIAVAEVSGVLGLVYAILSGTMVIPCVLWVCSLGAGIFHFPSRAWLESRRR